VESASEVVDVLAAANKCSGGVPNTTYNGYDNLGLPPDLNLASQCDIVDTDAADLPFTEAIAQCASDTRAGRRQRIATGMQRLGKQIYRILSNALVPPVVAVLVGLMLNVFIQATDINFYDLRIKWVYECLQLLGLAMVPCNLLVLGHGLSKGADFEKVSLKFILGIATMRLFVLPVITILLLWILCRILQGTPESAVLVAMTVSITPTANQINAMATLAGQDVDSISTAIFVQLMLMPFVLIFWLVIFATLLTQPWFIHVV
jgi:hypothetical protein